MNNYFVKQLNKDQYYLICMNYYGILNYIDEIEKEALIQFNEGNIVIDQLLVAGNGKNRFITCQFSYGKIKLDTAIYVSDTDEFRRISSEFFSQHLDTLKYSILTDSQIELLRQKQVV